MPIDMRKHQVALLRAEKKAVDASEKYKAGKGLTFLAIAAIVSGVTAGAAQAAEALGTDAPLKWAETLKSVADGDHQSPALALAAVYETLVNGHAALEGIAVDTGARLLPMVNGVPKRQVELVWNNLGLF